MDGAFGALVPRTKGFRLRGIAARWGWLSQVVERWVKESAKVLGGASLWEEQTCLDCLIIKNPLEVGLARAG
jgi:hypothetical protein